MPLFQLAKPILSPSVLVKQNKSNSKNLQNSVRTLRREISPKLIEKLQFANDSQECQPSPSNASKKSSKVKIGKQRILSGAINQQNRQKTSESVKERKHVQVQDEKPI